jgi:hypothetical protein
MMDYRTAINSSQPSTSAAAPSMTTTAPKFTTLASRYGMTDMRLLDASPEVQTVEQEYQAYITGALSPHTTDLLKFWEVRSMVLFIANYR